MSNCCDERRSLLEDTVLFSRRIAINIIAEYSEELVRELRVQLASDIKKMTEITLTRSWEYEKFDMDIKKYYQPDKKKKGGDNFVDKD